MNECYFRINDARGNFQHCNALTVEECNAEKCAFRKTEQEYRDGIKNAKMRLHKMGLTVLHTYNENNEHIVTTERKRV